MIQVDTPQRVRTHRSPRPRLSASPISVAPPLLSFHQQQAIKLVGLRSPLEGLSYKALLNLWHAFAPYQGWFPNQVDRRQYGALLQAEQGSTGFEYFTAVEVSSFERINADWEPLEVPEQHYAVFAHEGHLSSLRTTTHAIFAKSLPALNLTPLRHVPGVPLFLERYEESFDLSSGWGEIQIWVPLQQRR